MLDAYIIDALEKEKKERLRLEAERDAQRPRVYIYKQPPDGYQRDRIVIPLREDEEEVNPTLTRY
ncbi:MAG TPA: hypothetical protein VJI98_03355 [Candidatus Nanoarchaeia archaeon]|nr:hypothetical protein [Candidatus Nanoarchaeia archaeon]